MFFDLVMIVLQSPDGDAGIVDLGQESDATGPNIAQIFKIIENKSQS